MKIPYSGLLLKIFYIFRFCLKSDRNREHFMWRPAISCYNWDRLCCLWGTDWDQRNNWQSKHLAYYETSTGSRICRNLRDNY